MGKNINFNVRLYHFVYEKFKVKKVTSYYIFIQFIISILYIFIFTDQKSKKNQSDQNVYYVSSKSTDSVINQFYHAKNFVHVFPNFLNIFPLRLSTQIYLMR